MAERHRHSLSSTAEPIHPRSELYRAPPPSQRPDSPPKKRRSMAVQPNAERYKPASCLSSEVDAGTDASASDFRNFFPYIPNEVKHRKRTSNDQAKVLESVFDRNTKPDSALRQRLANELNMTPRGVQVWFQNRRAKEKLIGRKALAASATAYKKPFSPNMESSTKATVFQVLGENFQSSPPPCRTLSSSPESSPTRKAHISVPPELPSLPSWTTSQSLCPQIPQHTTQQTGPPQPSADLYNLRRPSLPTVMHHNLPSPGTSTNPPPFNLLARRGSVERLGGNPYARFLMSRVNSYQPRPTSLRESHDQVSLNENLSHPVGDVAAFESFEPPFIGAGERPRAMLEHRASMPHAFAGIDMQRRASMPTHLQATPSNRIPDRHTYTVSSRTISAPIPGPLPAANFSFGPPADSPAASSPAPAEKEGGDYLCHVPELANFSFGRRADDNDTEDDVSTSYDALSRFGSIASVAGSESSNTSAYYSDVGSCNELPPEWNPEARRGSFASSGQFLDMVSGLDLGHGGHEDLTGTIGPPSEAGDDSDLESAAYPSPAPTLSAGRSHANSPLDKLPNTPTQSLPISGSSELAHALQPNHEQSWDSGQSGPSHTNSAQYTVPNIYIHPSPDVGAIYPQVDPNIPSRSLPETTHFHNPPPYPHTSSAEGHYSTTGSYSPQNGHDILELHHAMEYNNPRYVAGAVDMSHVTSTVENTLHNPESFQYA